MIAAHYFVLLQKDQWVVTAGGQHWGPYRTEREAISAAIRAACETGGDA